MFVFIDLKKSALPIYMIHPVTVTTMYKASRKYLDFVCWDMLIGTECFDQFLGPLFPLGGPRRPPLPMGVFCHYVQCV